MTMKKRPLRIAVISDRHFPSETTDTQQIIKNTSAIIDAGVTADLVIPFKIQHLFKGNKELAEKLKQFYNLKTLLSIRQLKLFPAMKPNLEKITHGLIAPVYALLKRYPIVYTRNPIGALLSLLFGRRVIFEAYRMLGDEYPKLIRFFARFARKKRFLGMIAHSNLAGDSIIKAGFPKEKIKTFYNGYDPQDVSTDTDKKGARKRLGIAKKAQLIVYSGNMQRNKRIESIIDIAALLPKKTFYLVGGISTHIEPLRAYTEQKGVKNVFFTGHVEIAELAYYLQAADVLIIPPTAIPLKQFGRTVLPIKTFVYLAADRPILAGALPDVSEVLQNEKNALLVEPDNAEKTANTLTECSGDSLPAHLAGAGEQDPNMD